MPKYITIDSFIDTQDEGVRYPIGALYPREGYEPSEERVEALLSGNNAKGVALIKTLIELPAKTDEGEKPKKVTRRSKKVEETVEAEG